MGSLTSRTWLGEDSRRDSAKSADLQSANERIRLLQNAAQHQSDIWEISQVVKKMGLYYDRREWKKCVDEVFADTVYSDYSSLVGDIGKAVTTKESMHKTWNSFMPGFSATSHTISNIGMLSLFFPHFLFF